MKIIAFGASSSKHSINKQFATYTAGFFKEQEVEIVDLNDYPAPLFTVDVEARDGHPESVKQFLAKLQSADLLIISLAEHNGSYTAAFKNLFDWTSRVKVKVFDNKKVVLLSTSPGPRAGAGVMEDARSRFPIHGADIIAHFSLPAFQDNLHPEKGILNEELKAAFNNIIEKVKEAIA